jgi:hypothetical protein
LARELKDAGIEPKQADAITHVVQQAAEHGDPATRTDLDAHGAAVHADFDAHRTAVRADLDAHRTAVRADLDTLRAAVRVDITALEARLIKWMIGIALTATGIVVAAGTTVVLAVFRTLG